MYLTQPFHKAAIERPDACATVFAQRRTTFSQLLDRISRLAGAFHSLGVVHGDRIGMLALNSDRYIEYVFGTFWAGAVINPVNTRWSVNEIAYSLNDCGTEVLLVDDAFVRLAAALREQCPRLREVIYCGDGVPPAGMLDYEHLVATSRPVPDACRNGSDLAAVLYTGGTTGAPKGVMLSHANLVSNALSALAATPRPPVEAVLHVAPLFHVGGLALVFQAALRQAKHVVLPNFDPKAVLRAIAAQKVNETFIVPTMLQSIVDDPTFGEHDLGSFHSVLYGAAPIDPALLQRALAALPAGHFI